MQRLVVMFDSVNAIAPFGIGLGEPGTVGLNVNGDHLSLRNRVSGTSTILNSIA
ncbi:MAG: hypothetical protein DSM106950_36480 [Stigonema ocellatum SAG 48.90 = DSM 106950]|nr:hypothetical protein [Stigonema ocellatum SAG 48.90 = DSM 106950]